MKRFLLAALCSVAYAAPTVSNIHFDGTGDSSTRVLFNVSATFNSSRIRYGTSTCTSGAGGTLQGNTSTAVAVSGAFPLFDMALNISGLTPSTSYFVCPEVSDDAGMTWSSGVAASVSTLARTTVLPIAPTTVPTNFPAQSGTSRNVSGASDCSDAGTGLQARLNISIPGDTIVVPAGNICTGTYTLPNAREALLCAVGGTMPCSFSPSAVRTSDSRITITGHPFTENQEVRISAGTANSGCLPGTLIFASATNNQAYNCDIASPTGWRKGGKFWVHVVDANNVQLLDASSGSAVVPGYIVFTANAGTDQITFAPTYQQPSGYKHLSDSGIAANTIVQFHSTGTLPAGLSLNTDYFLLSACAASVAVACVTQVSLSSGGAAVNITGTGSGVHRIVDQGLGTMYMMPAPPALGTGQDIVITSSGTLPSVGTRITSASDAQMFHLRANTPLDSTARITGGILSHNYRIVGALFDTGTNSDYLTTVDPRPYCGIFSTQMDNSNIIFDRVRVQGAGYPNRFGCSVAMYLDGANVGFINSDLRGMDYWHPWPEVGGFCSANIAGCTSAGGSTTTTVVTITPGKFHGGVFTTTTTTNIVITLTGGGGITGSAYVYFAMDGTIKVLPPTGTTWTCTGGAGAGGCTVLTAVATPTWPLDGNSRLAGGRLGVIHLTAGSISGADPTYGGSGSCFVGPDANGCMSPAASASVNNSEGSQAILAGRGPGPYIIDNSYISGTGIPLHFDDSGGFMTRGDYTITRNTFDTPVTQQAGGPSSDGLRYFNRQPLEWKGGQRILISQCTFTGNFSEDTPVLVAVAVTPRQGGTVTDFDFSNNIVSGGGGIMIPSPIDTQPASVPAKRIRISNNLFQLNGWTHYLAGVGSPRGWAFYGGWGYEDVLIDHNTIYDSRGNTPSMISTVDYPAGGVIITNNVYFFTGNIGMITNSVQGTETAPNPCSGISNKLGMDCIYPGYVFTNNVIIPSWLDTTPVASGFITKATVDTALSTLTSTNFVPAGASQVANVALVNFAVDLSLAPASPYYASGTGGSVVGYSGSGASTRVSFGGLARTGGNVRR